MGWQLSDMTLGQIFTLVEALCAAAFASLRILTQTESTLHVSGSTIYSVPALIGV